MSMVLLMLALLLSISRLILKKSTVYTNGSDLGSATLKQEYISKRPGYQGQTYVNDYAFDAELVENAIVNMKRSKAACLDSITSEHLLFSHALLPCILAKLFKLMISIGYVSLSFGQSYTVPIPPWESEHVTVLCWYTSRMEHGFNVSCNCNPMFSKSCQSTE